jgi:hypothetical protein
MQERSYSPYHVGATAKTKEKYSITIFKILVNESVRVQYVSVDTIPKGLCQDFGNLLSEWRNRTGSPLCANPGAVICDLPGRIVLQGIVEPENVRHICGELVTCSIAAYDNIFSSRYWGLRFLRL